MKLSRVLTYAATIAGSAAAQRSLQQRMRWEKQHNAVAICIDFDDVTAAAIRAGISFDALLTMLLDNGATHVSLPELTLNRLIKTGQLISQAPARPRAKAPAVGHWNYLHGAPALVAHIAQELKARLGYTQADLHNKSTLIFAGDIPTIGNIGLGFDSEIAAQISKAGLNILPQVVAYDWPEPALIERTLHQAGHLSSLLGFAGTMVLGHEMHLNATVKAMAANNLNMVWLAESREQRGDWFVAKAGAPNIVLGHRWPHETMLSFDYHSANHAWLNLVKERGIRLCYLNFFRELHATEPLEGIEYVHHLKHVLEDAGYRVSAEHDLTPPLPIPTPTDGSLAMTGLAVGGLGAATLNNYFDLPEGLAVPLALAGAAAGSALPQLDTILANRKQSDGHSHDHDHDHTHLNGSHSHSAETVHAHNDHSHGDDSGSTTYSASYAPKLLALAAAICGPLAATAPSNENVLAKWLDSIIYPASAASALASATSGSEYQLRVEEFKGFNLDWALPLAMTALKAKNSTVRNAALTAIGTAWVAATQLNADPLALIDPNHAEGHTHHISAATRIIGDSAMKFGPKPARKWAGLGPIGAAIGAGSGAGLLGPLGYAMGLVGFRRPERPLEQTLDGTVKSFGIGAAIALLVLLVNSADN